MQERRRLSILGSTGSIGTSTLQVVRAHPERFKVVSLSCGSSIDTLIQQAEEFEPEFLSVSSDEVARALRLKMPARMAGKVKVFSGTEGHRKLIEESKPDVLMSAMMGTHGLSATLQAVRQEVPVVGIANKEILVMAGVFILEALKTSPSKLIPVDSEHSAIFQSMMGNDFKSVQTIYLTGSGGPFRKRDRKTFSAISKQEALKHPNWSMGAKITIDSATMMNKGLEFIEARRLFHLPAEQIQILIHPESIVHSMVEYFDGSVLAQLGVSDMCIPISLALAYPDRLPLPSLKRLNFVELGSLHFEAPDYEKFRCLKLALEADKMGDEGPIILNAANEIAVARFLNDEIPFLAIEALVEEALQSFAGRRFTSLDEVIELDREVKAWTTEFQMPSSELSQAY